MTQGELRHSYQSYVPPEVWDLILRFATHGCDSLPPNSHFLQLASVCKQWRALLFAQIRHLKCRRHYPCDEEPSLAQLLKFLSQRCPYLRTLDLTATPVILLSASLLSRMPNTLSHLALDVSLVESEDFSQLPHTLTSLALHNCSGLTGPLEEFVSAVDNHPPAFAMSMVIRPLRLKNIPVKFLRQLDLSGCNGVTDDTLVWLSAAQFSMLQILNISRTKITDTGLAHLRALSQSLMSLDLSRCRVTDAGVCHVAALTRLRVLRLAGINRFVIPAPFTDVGLRALSRLSALTLLDICDCGSGITALGVSTLSTNLRTLHLGSLERVETSSGVLRRFSHLETLVLPFSVNDSDVRQLPPSLTALSVDAFDVGPVGLRWLPETLKTLHIRPGSLISDQCLQTDLPKGLTRLILEINEFDIARAANVCRSAALAPITEETHISSRLTKKAAAGLADKITVEIVSALFDPCQCIHLQGHDENLFDSPN